MLSAEQERAGFSLRLGASLSDLGWTKLSPTRLAFEFNLRAGASSVTLHAARKWIMGEAIPTQARIVLLANWLHVNAAWLRFGGKLESSEPSHLGKQDLILLGAFSLLEAPQKKLVREMIELLTRRGLR
jgi:hypothetical protein